MTPEELQAIRARDTGQMSAFIGHKGDDRHALLAEVDRLKALTDDTFWVPLTQHEAEVALHIECESRDMAIIIGLKDEVARLNGEIDDRRAAWKWAQAEIERLKGLCS